MKQNKERDKKVLNLFNSKKTCSDIVKELGISKLTVKKVLSNFGIDYSERLKEQKEWKLKQVPILYSQGKSQLDLEKELGLTRKTIRNILKNSNVEYRSQSDSISLSNGHYINHDAFDNLTDPKVLYFIGFIYTDGHVTINHKKNENSISVEIHKQDVDILEKFRDFLKCNYKIVNTKENTVRLRVFSKKLCNVLKKLGFTSRKTYDLVPHEKLKYSRDFWRGCVDGDGCLHFDKINQYWIINLVGTLDTCIGLREYLNSELQVNRNINKAGGKNLFTVIYRSNIAKQVSKLLYKDAEVYLDRKYQKYLEIQEYHD